MIVSTCTHSVPNLWSDEDMHLLLGTYGLVVIPRAGTDLDALIASHSIINQHRDNLRIAEEAVSFPVSSSLIRALLRSGRSPRYLLHDSVLEYVHENKLWPKEETQHQSQHK